MASFIAPSSSCNVILPLCTASPHPIVSGWLTSGHGVWDGMCAGKHRHLVHTGFELLKLLQGLCFGLRVLIVVQLLCREAKPQGVRVKWPSLSFAACQEQSYRAPTDTQRALPHPPPPPCGATPSARDSLSATWTHWSSGKPQPTHTGPRRVYAGRGTRVHAGMARTSLSSSRSDSCVMRRDIWSSALRFNCSVSVAIVAAWGQTLGSVQTLPQTPRVRCWVELRWAGLNDCARSRAAPRGRFQAARNTAGAWWRPMVSRGGLHQVSCRHHELLQGAWWWTTVPRGGLRPPRCCTQRVLHALYNKGSAARRRTKKSTAAAHRCAGGHERGGEGSFRAIRRYVDSSALVRRQREG